MRRSNGMDAGGGAPKAVATASASIIIRRKIATNAGLAFNSPKVARVRTATWFQQRLLIILPQIQERMSSTTGDSKPAAVMALESSLTRAEFEPSGSPTGRRAKLAFCLMTPGEMISAVTQNTQPKARRGCIPDH